MTEQINQIKFRSFLKRVKESPNKNREVTSLPSFNSLQTYEQTEEKQ